MADNDDLDALKSGEIDLVNADFRGASLVGFDIKGRDLRGAKFHKADLTGANLSGSTLSGAEFHQCILSDADLSFCTGNHLGFVHVDFQRAIFFRSVFTGLICHTCNFRHADLSGADFSGAALVNDNIFEDTKSDEHTLFDGASILRPQKSLPVFRYYGLSRGQLIRI